MFFLLGALVRSCHPVPTVAVTLFAAGLGARAGLGPARLGILGAAVLLGQLTIGWGNDLVDAGRDRAAGRRDKPVAGGRLGPRVVVGAIGVAAVGAVWLSGRLGPAVAIVHVVLVVGSGWAYNLGLKRTLASFVPYAVAFGALPAVATLSALPPAAPPVWMVAAGALLGVGAHALDVLPDLDADAATGVRGLPHALGERGIRLLAAGSLSAGCVAAVVGADLPSPVAVGVGAAVVPSAVLIVRGRGRAPFAAAVGIAAIVVVALLLPA